MAIAMNAQTLVLTPNAAPQANVSGAKTIQQMGITSAMVADGNVLTVDGGAMSKAPAKAAPSFEFSYCESNQLTPIGASKDGELGTYDLAILIPPTYAGMTISEVYFRLNDPSVLEDVKMWVSSTLPLNVDDADICTTPTELNDYTAYSGGVLPEPYTVPVMGCYVGYSFTVTNAIKSAGKSPILVDLSVEDNGGLLVRDPLTFISWANLYGAGRGNLTTMVVLNGEQPADGAMFSPTFTDTKAYVGGTGKSNISMINVGTNNVLNFSFTVTDPATGEVSAEKTANISGGGLATGQSVNFDVEVPASAESGYSSKVVTLTKVNGQDNGALVGHESEGRVLSLANAVNRKVVEEQWCSSGCIFGVRGYVGMEQGYKQRPDNYIGICIHGNQNNQDPMVIDSYKEVSPVLDVIPFSFLNRINPMVPYYGTDGKTPMAILNDIDAQKNAAVEASVDVAAAWAGERSEGKIDVATNVVFQYNAPEQHYALAYAVTADGLKDDGKGGNWKQTNFFPIYAGQYADDKYLEEYCNMESTTITDMVYNNVAIESFGIVYGLNNSIQAPIVEGATQTHTYSIDLSDNSLAQPEATIKVVAMLIDTDNGEIINANETEVGGKGSGICINNATADGATVVARYAANGQQVTAPVKGLNILKMSDGSIIKVIK